MFKLFENDSEESEYRIVCKFSYLRYILCPKYLICAPIVRHRIARITRVGELIYLFEVIFVALR